MKFSFISPGPNRELSLLEKSKAIGSWPPLGMLYIATMLRNEGIEVSLLDQAAQRFTTENVVKWIRKEDPDILGFSTLASSGLTAARIAKEVKKENPNVLVVFGNYYATFNAERILKKYPYVDLIVRGEGEKTTLELVKCLRKKGNLKRVRGITFRNNGHIISTPDMPLIKDVDAIPFPDRKLLNAEYHSIIVGANAAPKKFTSIISSRGCVYRCRFCACQKFARGVWRPRSVENTLEELRLLVSEGYKQFLFVDDSFTLNPKRIIRLCREIRKEKMDIEWICEGRVDNCSYTMLREIVKAGCKIIYFGIESATQRILDYYKKQITPEQSKTAVKTARKAGMDVIVGSFIVGAPTETKEEIMNTLEFVKRIPLDFPQFNILGVYPGMDIWDELKMRGVLNEDKYWETGVWVSEISSDTVPAEEIRKMIHTSFQHFLRRPSYLMAQLLRTIKSPYRLNVVVNNLNRIDIITESINNIA